MTIPPAWVLALPLVVFWDSALVLPLKLLVVSVHELGHTLAALATGGHVIDVVVALDSSGHAAIRGGNPLIVLNAGYVASLGSAAGLLMLAKDPQGARAITYLSGAFLIYAGFSWYEEVSWGRMWLVATGVALLLGTPVARGKAIEALVQSVAVFNVVYTLYDIVSDAFTSGQPTSDAGQLAALTGLPPELWSGLWVAAALGMLVAMRRYLV